MDKNRLIKLIEDGKSTYEIAKELNYSQSNIRYWLDKYGLKTNIKKGEKICPRCKKKKILRYQKLNHTLLMIK